MADVSWGHGNIAGATGAIDPLSPQRLAISPSAVQVEAGDSEWLDVTAYYRDGSSRVVTTLGRWSIVDSAIASVGVATGRVTGIAAGETSVRFAYGIANAQAAVVVTAAQTGQDQDDDDWWYLV